MLSGIKGREILEIRAISVRGLLVRGVCKYSPWVGIVRDGLSIHTPNKYREKSSSCLALQYILLIAIRHTRGEDFCWISSEGTRLLVTCVSFPSNITETALDFICIPVVIVDGRLYIGSNNSKENAVNEVQGSVDNSQIRHIR